MQDRYAALSRWTEPTYDSTSVTAARQWDRPSQRQSAGLSALDADVKRDNPRTEVVDIDVPESSRFH